MMRKLIPLLFLVILVAAIPSAFAGSDTVSVNLTLSDPSVVYSVPLGGEYRYETYKLEIGASGDYTFNMVGSTLPVGVPLWAVYTPCGFTGDNFVTGAFLLGLPGHTVNIPAGTYTLIQSSNLGSSANGDNPVLGSFDTTVTGPGSVSISGSDCGVNPDGDPDGDGIPSSRDNCRHDYNPSQEDGWAGSAGDVCDSDWYNRTGQGVAGFEQKDGMYHVHGNCLYLDDGAPRCPVVGSFDPSSLTPENAPMQATTGDAGAWSVWVHYLHSKHGQAVYQVNIYSTNPPQPDTLVDDRLEFHVAEGGSWQWHMRGGNRNFNGI